MPDIPFIDPGELHQKITIQQLTTSPDSFGEATPTWTTFATVWAKVEQLKGTEAPYASEMTPIGAYRVTIRYLPGLTEEMQGLWGVRTLKIENVNDLDGRGIQHVLTCVERKA